MNALYGGHSMVGALRRVLVWPPCASRWRDGREAARWQEFGFSHPPDAATAEQQHEQMVRRLREAGCEVWSMSDADGITLDGVYVHDASLITDWGVVCLRMGKPSRFAEPAAHRRWCAAEGIPVLGEIEHPALAEAGDIVWLNSLTLLVGRGYRTSAEGIEQLRALLGPRGIMVASAPLPHAGGPDSCLHLMSLISLLDDHTALVDLPRLSVETVELLLALGYRMIQIDPAERDSLACNVLALGGGRLLALEENRKTNERLRGLGYDVRTFSGSEIGINGGGGPTCLTRPILRIDD
jgi:N-dimethylarginine dimethylaminohydrolase